MGTVTALTVNSGGAGYAFTPTVMLNGGGGTGATASATVTDGVVTAITITSAGTGYTSVPTVSVASPIATATAAATINSSLGTVTGLTVSSGGSGYLSVPTVMISGGGGSGATATATVMNDVVTAITITNPGSGYTSAPTVTVGTPSLNTVPVSDGTHVYQVFLTDLAGNKSPLSNSLTVSIAPNAPSAPVLAMASESGTPGSNVTNITTNLVFTVATAAAGNTVTLFRAPASAPTNTTQVGTIVGPGSITDPGPLLPGSYIYTAVQTDQSNIVSRPSAPLDVTIVTAATAPTRVRLDPSSTSGTPGSNVTNVTGSLIFDVFGISAGTTVLLFNGGTQVASLTTADATATATINPSLETVSAITVNSGGARRLRIRAAGHDLGRWRHRRDGHRHRGRRRGHRDRHHECRHGLHLAPDGHDRPTDRDGDSHGDDQQWHGWRRFRRFRRFRRHGHRVHDHRRWFRLLKRAHGHDLGWWRLGCDGQRHRNKRRGHCDYHYQRRQWLHLGPDRHDRGPRGEVMISTPSAPVLAAGTYQFAAEQKDGAGNTSAPSPSVSIQIVTTGTTPTLALDPGSDSGTPGDDITNVNGSGGVFPQFDVGNVAAGATLNLLRNGVVVNTLTAAPGGTAVISDQGAVLADGIYQYTVQQIDNVGNTATSTALTVRIVTSAAAPAAPALQAASDTGVLGDNVTSVRNPQFNVSGVPAGATLSLFRNGVVVNTVSGGAGGTVAIGDPGPLLDGQYIYTASLLDGAGNPSPTSGSLTVSIVSVTGDYTDSGFANLAVFDRVNPGELDTFIAGGITPPGGSNAFGSGTLDIPFQGDLDGDGKTDLILYRPSTSQWFVQESSGGFKEFSFGAPGDIPVVGDFDGVGHDELAVYRPSTGQWFVAGHSSVFATFGGEGDIPVALRNYYGTGQDVLAVFRPSTGTWFVAGQSSGISFGGAGDIAVPLFNYYGTGQDVLAVFRPSTSQWFVAGQGSGISFGGAGDVPIAADFDGVGHDEIGVYRPSTGQWFVAGHSSVFATFGGPADIPLEAPYLYRVAGLSTAGIPVASLYAFNFGASAAALSAGSGSTITAVAATGSPSSTGTGSGAVVTPPAPAKHQKHVTARATAAGVVAQSNTPTIHDAALAALQGTLGRRRKRGRSSLLP